MKRTVVGVFESSPGERISMSIVADGVSCDITLSAAEALALAQQLVVNARTSAFGSKEHPNETLAPELVMLGEGLDQCAFALGEFVRHFPGGSSGANRRDDTDSR